MQSFLFGYARYFNRRYGKVGHLFQGRYRAILCDKDAYLLELVRYIHLNPVRAKVVRDPERYLWTSHLSYLGKGSRGLTDTEFVLGQFGKNSSVRRRKYREFMLEGLESGYQEKFYEVKDQRYLGEESFINRIENEKRDVENVVYDGCSPLMKEEWNGTTGCNLRHSTLFRQFFSGDYTYLPMR